MSSPMQFRVTGLSANVADQVDSNSLAEFPPANGEIRFIGSGDAPGIIVGAWIDEAGKDHEGQFRISG